MAAGLLFGFDGKGPVRRLGLLAIGLVVSQVCAAPAVAQEPKRVALVIGNGDYAHVPPLPNPHNDARALAEKLAELDFEVTRAIDLDLAGTRDVILEFGRQSYGADISLIFYAGHGLQAFGDNYLLSIDSQLSRPEDLLTSSLRAAELHSVFAFAQPRLGVLILDACRDNPFVGTVTDRRGLASGSVAAHDLGSSRNSAGLLIAFSAAPGTVAADGKDGNSPFTTALLQWVDRPGLEIGDMFRRVRQTVLTLTDGKQVPWVEESLLEEVYFTPPTPGEDAHVQQLAALLRATILDLENPSERRAAQAFFARLLPGSSAGEADFIPAALEVQGSQDEPRVVEESLVWLSIRTSTDPTVFEQFLAEFPDGIFADLARARRGEVAALAAGEADRATAFEPSPEDLAKVVPEATPSEAADPAAAEAALALDRDERTAVQRLLARAGHYGGPLDGAIGPVSRGAIEAFQRELELEPTGYLEMGTLNRLVARAAPPLLEGDLAGEPRRALHAVAAIAQHGPDAEPEVIRVATHQRHPEVHEYWRELADSFEAEHPGTAIEYDIRLDIEYRAELLSMLGSEAPPDVFLTYGGGHLRSIVEAGFARDLTEEMGAGWALTYKPGSLADLIIDGQIYAVPMRMTLVSLWANRRLLEGAGVDPADLRSWDGLLAGVRRLREAGVTPISVGADDGWPMGLYWGALAQGLGGREALERALAGEDEGFGGGTFVEAGRMLRELAALDAFQPGYAERTENEAIGTFTDGWAAMTLNGDWIEARAIRNWPGGPERAAEDLIRIPFPPEEMASDVEITYGGVDSWVVREDAPELALDFLRELAGLESQQTIAELGFGIPAIAGADSAIEDPLLRDVASELTLSEYHQLYYDQLLGPFAGEVLNDASVALAVGDLTPERAAEEVETAWAQVRSAWGIEGVEDLAPAEREPAAAE